MVVDFPLARSANKGEIERGSLGSKDRLRLSPRFKLSRPGRAADLTATAKFSIVNADIAQLAGVITFVTSHSHHGSSWRPEGFTSNRLAYQHRNPTRRRPWSVVIAHPIAVCFRLEWQRPLGGSAVFPCVFLSL